MQQAGVEKSPFVLVFEKVGIPYAADIFNFVIRREDRRQDHEVENIRRVRDTHLFKHQHEGAFLHSGLYASGRMLWSLSNEKTLPACFAKVNKRGVPVTALSVSMLGGT
jgi:S-methylmethionine transporter